MRYDTLTAGAFRPLASPERVTPSGPCPGLDLYRLADLAPEGTVVVRDRFTAGHEDWTAHDAFVAGDAASNAGAVARLLAAGVEAARIRTATDGPIEA